jgi:hypothetical protein
MLNVAVADGRKQAVLSLRLKSCSCSTGAVDAAKWLSLSLSLRFVAC